MNDDGHFALVTRPPGALAKVEPGAKRILSGMVADALALANRTTPLRIILVDHNPPVSEALEMMIRFCFKNLIIQLFDNSSDALQELTQRNPDLLITQATMPGLHGYEMVGRLLKRKATYPIIMMSAYPPAEQWARYFADQGFNVSFLAMPFTMESIRRVMKASLGDLATKYYEQ